MFCRKVLPVCLLLFSMPLVVTGQNASDFYLPPKTVPEFWRAARFELRTGNYENAADRIKGLLAKIGDAPNDKEVFDFVENPPPGGEAGFAQILRLRNIPKWNANPKLDAEAKANVEKLIEIVTKAVNNELKSEERIRRYIGALSGLQEEATYAIKELRKSGNAVVPVFCNILSNSPEEEIRTSIFRAIPQLGDETVPGLITYINQAETSDRVEIVSALLRRPNFRELVSQASTDPVPTLVYYWGNPKIPETLRNAAANAAKVFLLKDPSKNVAPELRTGAGLLNLFARSFLEGKANLGEPTGAADGVPTYTVWVPDGKTVKEIALSKAATNEHYGLLYARWALDLEPENTTVQETFLSIAIEGQANRTGGVEALAKTAPQLHAILSKASYDLLYNLLEDGIRTKRSTIILAVVRTLGERAELRAAKSEEIKLGEKSRFRPGLLVKAFDYPDPRVRFAAADALLRIPGEPQHGRTSEIMKLLTASLAADAPAGGKQKALYADPDPVRINGISTVLQQAGYEVEAVNSGRQLMKRIQQAADIDIVIVDRHIVDPMLTDLLPQLKADIRGKTLPLFVVASIEGITPVNKLTALARLATVVAFEDLPDHPYVDLPRNENELKEVKQFYDAMQALVQGRFTSQVKRMEDLVAKAGFTLDEETRARIRYLTLQTIPYATMDNYAKNLLIEERLAAIKLLSPDTAKELEGAKIAQLRPRISVDPQPSREDTDHIIRLMRITAETEATVLAERLPRLEGTWDSFWSKDLPRLPAIVGVRHPEIEMAVTRKVSGYNRVRVLPAVFTPAGLNEELVQLVDAKAPMLSPAEKKEHAAIAMNWLRKIARGEVLGYRIMQAENEIREALKSDDLGIIAIDTISRMPSKLGQQDLLTVTTTETRPAPLRIAAADGLIRNVQLFGKFVTQPQIDALVESAKVADDLELRGKLNSAVGVLKPDGKATGAQLKTYTPDLTAPKEKAPEPKEEKKEDPKEEKKEDPKEKM